MAQAGEWTLREDAILRKMWRDGELAPAIAESLGTRSVHALYKRVRRLKLPVRETQKTGEDNAMNESVTFEHMLREGSRMLLDALNGVSQPPQELMWSKLTGIGQSRQRIVDSLAPEPDIPRVNRDPCPRCGSKHGSCNHKTTGRLVTA